MYIAQARVGSGHTIAQGDSTAESSSDVINESKSSACCSRNVSNAGTDLALKFSVVGS